MKKVVVHTHGGPETLTLDDVAMPEPGPGEALVAIAASGVNFIDVYFRIGLYAAESPTAIGSEAAGVVERVGPGVTEVNVGDRVAYTMVRGSYAEYAVVPASKLVPVPAGVSLDLAAAVMLQGTTAHYLTRSTFPLDSSHTCLIHAAAGGLGSVLVQMAKARGARVIGTVSTAAKAALIRELGADETILYTEQDFETEVMRLTGGRGVDVVIEHVGEATWRKSVRSLARGRRLLLLPHAAMPYLYRLQTTNIQCHQDLWSQDLKQDHRYFLYRDNNLRQVLQN